MGIIQASIPVFFILIAVELLYAQFGRRALYRLNDSISDLSAGTLSQIAGVFTKVLLIGVYGWAFANVRIQLVVPHFALRAPSVPDWPDGVMVARMPGGWVIEPVAMLGWVVAFLAVDFAYYWFHRYSHEVNLLWAGHIVHHSSEEYNLAVALRQTAVGGLLSWVFYVPLALVGITLTQFATCYAINLVYQFWIHTRAIARLPAWAELVFNTPSHHRVHHGVNPEYQDRNYAGVFIIWDRWFGTFTRERHEPVYGLTFPLKSWNPIWAQVHHYAAIARQVQSAKSWNDRWHYVFGSPAWRPASEGGPIVIPPVLANTFLKFDPAVPEPLAYYALVQFVLAIPVALLLLAPLHSMSAVTIVASGFYVVLTLTNVGGILEGRRWALVTERARLLAIGVTAIVAVATHPTTIVPKSPSAWWPVMAMFIVFVSLLTIWHYRADFTTDSDERMDLH